MDLSNPPTTEVGRVLEGDTIAKGLLDTDIDIPIPKSCPKGNVVPMLIPPNPFPPTPSSKLEFGNEETGRPRNLPVSAHTRSSSSFNRAFSIRRCCSSSEISPMMAGPPQLEHMGFLIASLIDMFSALSLSFSCLSKVFSCRSNWVWYNRT